MPFFDERRPIGDLTNIPVEEPPPEPAFGETWKAAFRTVNVTTAFAEASGRPDPGAVDDPSFNAIDYVKDDPHYAPYVESFAGVMNKRAADSIKIQIDQENADRRTIAASGWKGTIAQMAAGVFDLPTLLSFGGGAVIGGGTRLALAGRMAAGAAAGAGIQAGATEIGLQATHYTRTREESLASIGGSILLGGALGALAGRYLGAAESRALSTKLEGQGAAWAAADKEFANLGNRSTVGAAAADVGPLVLKDEGFISKIPFVNKQDPLIRLQLSEFDDARQAVRKLAETPLEYVENAAGVATERGGSVETRIKMWNAPLARALREIDTAYARYFHNTPEPTTFQRFLAPGLSEFDRVRGSTGRLTYQDFKREVGKAAFSGEEHAIPQVAEAARIYRKLDDAMKQAAVDARLLPEDVAVQGDVSHLFRLYDKQRIIAKRDEFTTILNDYFLSRRDHAAKATTASELAAKPKKLDPQFEELGRMSDAEVKGLVNDTVDRILGNADTRIPYDIVAGPRGPLKERLLKIPSKQIEGFLNTDIEDVLRAQTRTMSADVEIARKFGDVNLSEEIRKINDAANGKIALATTEKARIAIDDARKAAIRDLSGIRDRLRGTYALPADPNSLVLRAGRVARNVNYLRLLGGMTVSAIPDLAKTVFSHGLASTFSDGFLPMVRNMRGFRLAAQEVKDAGTALDMVLDSRVMALSDITDVYGRHTAFERGLHALTNRFGLVSLMAPWNATLKQFSGLVTMTNILRASQRLAAGTGTAKDIRALAASGIDSDLAGRIAREFAEHGEEQGGILLAKAGDWADPVAREAFRAAVVREVDKIIVTPGQDKPLWMSTELGKTIGQFKSFSISSMQKTMLAGLQQRDAATLNGALLSLGLGAMTYWARKTAANQPTSEDPRVWAAEALDWSGLTGWLMDANGVLEKATRGHVGISALTGKQISRYATRNTAGALLGPTLDAASDIFQGTGAIAAGDFSRSDLHTMRQLVPLQNLFYLRTLFDRVEKATGSALDLPDKRKN
ncbi:hypothetical protein ACWGTO_07585 [Mesorhizobium sp. PL10]